MVQICDMTSHITETTRYRFLVMSSNTIPNTGVIIVKVNRASFSHGISCFQSFRYGGAMQQICKIYIKLFLQIKINITLGIIKMSYTNNSDWAG